MVTSFDLHRLGWYEFQELSRTVLREVLGHTVAGFADGSDGGRDAAFQGTGEVFEGDTLSGHFVAQCKHTSKPSQTLPYSRLEPDLEKARALAEQGVCDVYLLMTNARVTDDTERRVREKLKANGVDEFRLLDGGWFDERISSNPKLRMLVPRLYGLGDLTLILNDLALRQADAILRYYATDLAKLVRTGTYETAERALREHRFVLLSGEPMTGKTTIATQLALAAADGYEMRVVVLDRASEFRERWNPGDPALFWLDDAFGETQFNSDLTAEWQRAVPSVKTAIAGGLVVPYAPLVVDQR